jgi:haloacetate dehalogenase
MALQWSCSTGTREPRPRGIESLHGSSSAALQSSARTFADTAGRAGRRRPWIINADPDSWYRGDAEAIGRENYDEWRKATRNPDVVRAMLEDYRAGLTVDRQHEEADREAGNRVRSPLLVLWSRRGDLEDLYGDPLAIWRDWADDVRGHSIDSAHHMAEEAPEALAVALAEFFAQR